MMNGCGNFEFRLVSNERNHLSRAVYILRGEPTQGAAKVVMPRPLIGFTMDDEWLVLWDWQSGEYNKNVSLFPAPVASNKSIVSFLENWLDNSPMVLTAPDIDGSREPDAFEIVSHRWKWERYDKGPLERRLIYPIAGEVFSIRRVWSEYHK